MTHTPRTTLLVNASVLQDLLAKHPEVELELVKNAADQIAERFKHRTLGQQNAIVDRLVAQVNAQLENKYRLPDKAIQVIRSCVEEHMKKMHEDHAKVVADKAMVDALKRAELALPGKLDNMVSKLIEAKLSAVMKAAR